jgi:hypothetical protein
MPTQTPQVRYKICTTNCTQYSAEKGDLPCKKGNFAFVPPLGRECTFSLLEGQLENAQPPERFTAEDDLGPLFGD